MRPSFGLPPIKPHDRLRDNPDSDVPKAPVQIPANKHKPPLNIRFSGGFFASRVCQLLTVLWEIPLMTDSAQSWSLSVTMVPQYGHFPLWLMSSGAPQFGQLIWVTLG